MKNETAETIRQGQLFNVAETATGTTRAAIEFEPQTLLDTPPDSVTGITAKNDVLQPFELQALPIKGIRQTLIAVGAGLVFLIGWQIFQALQTAYLWHPLWGFICLLSTTLIASLAGFSLWQFWQHGNQLQQVLTLQDTSSKLKPHKNFGKAAPFIADLALFYSGKPQEELLQKAIKQLPDYANDAEVIAHIERLFIHTLDKEALRRVAKYSCQTATSVAASPWASLDMLLSLFRNIKMINEVGQIYGLRPSLLNRYRLLKQVILHLLGSGASELILDQALQELGTSGLASIVGLRLTQGLGAGIYSAKIGIAAMEASRPIVFGAGERPRLK